MSPAPRDPDDVLAEALRRPLPGEGDDGELLTLEELAERAGVAPAVLEALAREELLVARDEGPPARYAASDVAVVRDGLALLEAGLPLGELLDLARRADTALRGVAEHAVELFVEFVRDPIRGQAATPQQATEDMLAALRTMLPATGTLVSHHFRRLVLAHARRRLAADRDGDGGTAETAEDADGTAGSPTGES